MTVPVAEANAHLPRIDVPGPGARRAPDGGNVYLPGIDVPLGRITLGGNRFGSTLDIDASYALLDRYAELGGTFVDTALVYADWLLPDVEPACSERLLGRWLASRGVADSVMVATKGGHPDLSASVASGTRPKARLDPASLRHDIEASLDHLGLARLPLWWLHRDDPTLPVGEILAVVEEFRSEGKLSNWGVTNWTATRLTDLRAAADKADLVGPVASSVGFALAPPAPGALAEDQVTLDKESARWHEHTQLPLVAYSAQAKGWFDHVVRHGRSAHDAIYAHGATRTLAAVLAGIGTELGATPTEVALAALGLLPFPTSAVVGPRTPRQLDSCWQAVQLPLDESHRQVLRSWIAAAIDAAGVRPLTGPAARPGQ